MVRRVYVWDTNPFNPYGAEVSRVISKAGFHCVRICRDAQILNATDKPWLPTASQGNATLLLRTHFALAILRATALFVLVRPVVVVPWLSTPYERLASLLWGALGSAVIVVHHDPTKARAGGSDSRLERLARRRSSRVVVHDREHVALSDNPSRTVVCAHPAYFAWAEKFVDHTLPKVPNKVLWFGTARPDKGFESLPDLASGLSKRGFRLTVAPGKLDQRQQELIENCPDIDVEQTGGYLDDNRLGRLLSECTYVVAPYRDITASGTVLMALTAGCVPMAYASEALESLLPVTQRSARVGDIDALVQSFGLVQPDAESSEKAAAKVDQFATSSWREAITALVAPV